MSSKYKINLNADVAVPQEYEYDVGSITPMYQKSAPVEKSDMSYLEALGKSTVPYKIAIWSQDYYDYALRAFDQNDDMVNADPSYDPVKLWKDYKLSDSDFYHIQKLDNMDQFYNFWEAKQDAIEVEKRISRSGLAGNIAAFGANILTDPTTYIGVNAATKLLSSKSSALIKYAVTGGAGAALYEAEQQLLDTPNMRDMSDSAINIAAGVVIGGVLGGATDYFSKAREKGLLKFKNKDFNEYAKEFVADAMKMESRGNDLSAAVSPTIGNQIKGKMARGAAWVLSPLGLKTRGQVMNDARTRDFFDKLVGRTAQTENDFLGIAAQDSLSLVNREWMGGNFNKVVGFLDELEDVIKTTKQSATDDVYKQALMAVRDGAVSADSREIHQVIARQVNKFFKEAADDLKNAGATWFRERKNYFSMVMRPDKISKDIKGFSEKFVPGLMRARQKAQDDLFELANELTRLEKFGAAQGQIDDILEEIRLTKIIADESAESISARARDIANLYASGMAHNDLSISQEIKKLIPSRMKGRLLDPKDFIDFIEVDPHKLMISYALEVSPYYASQKIFKDKSPNLALNTLVKELSADMASMKTSGDIKGAKGLEKDIKELMESVPKAWDDYTGQTSLLGKKMVGETAANIIQAAKDFSYMTKMGGQVLSSLPDLASIGIAHGIAGQKEFAYIISKLASSPELREMSKETAGAIGIGLDMALRSFLSEIARNDFMRLATGGGADWSQYIAKAGRIGANTMQFANGSLLYDTIVRRALVVAQQQLLRNSMEQVLKGNASKEIIADLAFLGIGKKDIPKMIEQMQKHGKVIDGVFFMQPEKWLDKNLGEKMLKALLKDNSRISITPGVGDTPHFFKVPGLNLLTQFKSWAVTATQVYGLQSLQKTDMNHRAGVVTLIGMASMFSVLKDYANGKEPVTDPDELIWQGITNSGIVGILPDFGGNFFARKWFDIESGGAKYGEYQDTIDTIAGPFGSTVRDIGGVLSPVVDAIGGEAPSFDNKWLKDLIDIMPIPIVKGQIKQYLAD